jgi:hypothetical protein
MTVNQKRDILVKTLLKELGSADDVRQFSSALRELDICDLQDDQQFEKAVEHEGAYIFTLITHYQFGLLPKLVELKHKIKGE